MASVGGLARRATVIGRARAAHPGAIVVDTGSIFAAEAGDASARTNLVLARGLVLMGYDVVNLSEADSRVGSLAAQALAGTKAPALVASAGIHSADASAAGSLLASARPYVIRQVGQVKVAFVGLTAPGAQPTSGRAALDPAGVEALSLVLPAARRDADVIVALADVPPEQAEALASAGLDLDVVLGGRSPASRPATRIGRTIISSAGGPEYVGCLTVIFGVTGKDVSFDWSESFLDDSVPADRELQALREEQR